MAYDGVEPCIALHGSVVVRVQGLGFGISRDLGVRVWDSGVGVQDLGFKDSSAVEPLRRGITSYF